MSVQKTGGKTLLWSIIMSSPGPLVVGLGLIGSHAATQIADFIRRSAELMAIILAFVVFKMVQKDANNEERRIYLERRANIFVGAMMCVAGAIMMGLALLANNEDKGNVIPSLVIAVLGGVANSTFWVRYARLNKISRSMIFAAQAKLYRAKVLVDASVTVALFSILFASSTTFAFWVDLIGSVVVSVYLIRCGAHTVYEQRRVKIERLTKDSVAESNE